MRITIKGYGIDSIIAWAKELASLAILDGQLLEKVEVTTSDVDLEHTLERVMRGAIVVSSDVAQGYKLNGFTKQTFTISAGSTATVSLWVF